MKKSITLRCAAKLNLSLDVTGKRPDGYHTLESIFQSISVYDTLDLSAEEGEGITLSCDAKGVPCDERNLAWKAAAAILEASGKQMKIDIRLQKHIPSGAGMGGGSSDAAGVLYGLNQLLECGFSEEQLREIGVKLGADVPFILRGGTAYAEGVGELLTPLKPLPALPVVVLKGEEGISTPAAYKAIDALADPAHPETKKVLEAIETQDIPQLCDACGNVFEDVVTCADVERAKEQLEMCGARYAGMTGSGSAVFGIFADDRSAEICVEQLRHQFAFAEVCKFVQTSFIEIQP